jgi:hypothetical protein
VTQNPARTFAAASARHAPSVAALALQYGKHDFKLREESRAETATYKRRHHDLASLQDPVLPIGQTRFRFPWVWNGTPAVIQSRATDETGYTQPMHQQLIAERGSNPDRYSTI